MGSRPVCTEPMVPVENTSGNCIKSFFLVCGGVHSPPPGRVCTFKKLLEMIIYMLYELPQIHYPYVRIFLKFQGGMYDPLSVWAVGAYRPDFLTHDSHRGELLVGKFAC